LGFPSPFFQGEIGDYSDEIKEFLGRDLLTITIVKRLNIYHICYHICYQMFHPERNLRAVILELLSEDGKSISALSRELGERGYDIHRLILTGYLRAMADLNALKEKDVPPAKIYVAVRGKEKDIYERVGEESRSMLGEGERSDALALFTLVKLFHRPLFQDEIARTGVRSIQGRGATKEERQEAKSVLVKSGFKVPDSSKAFTIERPDLEKDYVEMISRLVCSAYDVSQLVKETKQTRLTL